MEKLNAITLGDFKPIIANLHHNVNDIINISTFIISRASVVIAIVIIYSGTSLFQTKVPD